MKLTAMILVLCALILCGIGFVTYPSAHAQDSQEQREAVGRWTIHRAEIAVAGDVGGPARSSVNTILLDTATGETWLLWPSEDGNQQYGWIQLKRRNP